MATGIPKLGGLLVGDLVRQYAINDGREEPQLRGMVRNILDRCIRRVGGGCVFSN